MNKQLIVISFLFLFLCLVFAARATATVRKPVVAGTFYPASPQALRETVELYLSQVPEQPLEGEVKLLIVPHAGYIYSGPVAAYGFKQIQNQTYDIVAVIAPSHYAAFSGASVYDQGDFQTPLGIVKVDLALAQELIEKGNQAVSNFSLAHSQEHALEVELPFLQVVLGEFKLLPIVIGEPSYEGCKMVAEALYKVLQNKKALVVISTDLSHYHSYDVANLMDERTIDEIKKFSPSDLAEYFDSGRGEACGRGPVIVGLELAKKFGWKKIELLKYANSGDTAGTKDRVVGYVSMAILKEEGAVMGKENPKQNTQSISKEGRKKLLRIARETLEGYLSSEKKSTYEITEAELTSKSGAFVTLHKKGKLRGCIGHFISDKPLYQTVQEMALAAAVEDPRFPPLEYNELKDIDIEISVLSPMKKISSIDEIEMGKHGIYIKKGYRSGTFLPQVAQETGWSKEEFLGHLARDKAGLGWDGWKEAELYTYTAEVFGEEH